MRNKGLNQRQKEKPGKMNKRYSHMTSPVTHLSFHFCYKLNIRLWKDGKKW